MGAPTVVALLGKGGAGKTAVSALLAGALLDEGRGPLLLVDADPSCGLTHAVGGSSSKTIGAVKERLVDAAGAGARADELAGLVDWWVLEALQERERCSLLAMGRPESRGCFCSVNALLRAAITHLGSGFAAVIIDAEAGVEQIQRQVMERVDRPIVVTDGSRRGMHTAELLAELLRRYGVGQGPTALLVNRAPAPSEIPAAFELWGTIPHDPLLERFDAEGRSLLELPRGTPAWQALEAAVRGRWPL